MSTLNTRKDPIIVDSNIIGREVFFNNLKDKVYISYLTPNKKYTITGTLGNLIIFLGDEDIGDIYSSLNCVSPHLKYKAYFLLAKRTSSKQKVVKTISGRSL